MSKPRLFRIIIGTALILGAIRVAKADLLISNSIEASSVAVSGHVTVSSVTVSSLTVTNELDLSAASVAATVPRVVQLSSFTITSQQLCPVTTSFGLLSPVSIEKTITLKNAADRVRISLSGNLEVNDGRQAAYLTIFRDSTNLGDSVYGMATAHSNQDTVFAGIDVEAPVGITLTDAPGDTSPHVYAVYERVTNPTASYFPFQGPAYLILEEIGE